MKCDSCEVLRINGVLCHELGCPDAWKDYEKECKECGTMFRPETSNQECCSHTCYVMYNGVPCDCEECSSNE